MSGSDQEETGGIMVEVDAPGSPRWFGVNGGEVVLCVQEEQHARVVAPADPEFAAALVLALTELAELRAEYELFDHVLEQVDPEVHPEGIDGDAPSIMRLTVPGGWIYLIDGQAVRVPDENEGPLGEYMRVLRGLGADIPEPRGEVRPFRVHEGEATTDPPGGPPQDG